MAVESSRKDRNSVNVGIKACQKSEGKICYALKAYHKALINEENYTYYRKLTIDVEKSTGNSSPEQVANIHIAASIKENDYKEKFIIETKEKKLGYEFRLHRRDNVHDHCSLESQIFMPYRTVRVRGNAVHKEGSTILEFEIVPDVSVPSRKLGLELKSEQKNKEMSGYLKMIYPGMRKAVELTGRIQKEGILPVEGKLKLDSSAVDGKIYILEIVPEQQSRSQERRSIEYRLYTEDKRVDISTKLTKRVAREESEYVYEWSWKTQQQQKEGKLSLRLAEKRNGKPQVVELELVSSRVSSKLNSRITWGSSVPSALAISFESNNEKLAEIDIRTEDNCLVIEETLKSRQFMKNEICIGKKENDKMKIVSVKSYYQRRQSLNFEIEVDPQQPHLADINLKWDQRNFRLAVREVRQVLSDVQSRYISNADLQAIQQALRRMSDNARQALRDAKQKIQEIRHRYIQTLKQQWAKAKQILNYNIWDQLSRYIPVEYIKNEIIRPLIRTAECLWEKYMKFVRTHLPELYRGLWEETKKNVIQCLRTYCPADSFCYEFASILEHFEMEKVKMLASRKYNSLKRSASHQLERVQIPEVREWLERLTRTFRKQVKIVFERIIENRLVETLLNSVRKMQQRTKEVIADRFEKMVDWVLRLIKHAEKDQDFRVLKALVQETRDKAIHAWENKDSVLQNAWQPLKESVIEDYPKKWVKERMTIRRFTPKEGNIQIQIHHPLEHKHIQVLKNALVTLKNKVLSQK